jgi:hypothetical protein
MQTSPKLQNKDFQQAPSARVSPRWGRRILENAKAAGLTFGLSVLALQAGCSKAHLEAVTPRAPHNIYCDPKLGTVYVRPDGMDAVLSSPLDCGQNHACSNTIPFMALAFFYGEEGKNPQP